MSKINPFCLFLAPSLNFEGRGVLVSSCIESDVFSLLVLYVHVHNQQSVVEKDSRKLLHTKFTHTWVSHLINDPRTLSNFVWFGHLTGKKGRMWFRMNHVFQALSCFLCRGVHVIVCMSCIHHKSFSFRDACVPHPQEIREYKIKSRVVLYLFLLPFINTTPPLSLSFSLTHTPFLSLSLSLSLSLPLALSFFVNPPGCRW